MVGEVNHLVRRAAQDQARKVAAAALAGSGVLTQVSADAYAADTPSGVRLLARSRFRGLITRPGHAVLAVRWETGGHDGEPLPCSTPTSP